MLFCIDIIRNVSKNRYKITFTQLVHYILEFISYNPYSPKKVKHEWNIKNHQNPGFLSYLIRHYSSQTEFTIKLSDHYGMQFLFP